MTRNHIFPALPALDMRGCARGNPAAIARAKRARALCESREQFQRAYGWTDAFIARIVGA